MERVGRADIYHVDVLPGQQQRIMGLILAKADKRTGSSYTSE
jgi:hypothetical protein